MEAKPPHRDIARIAIGDDRYPPLLREIADPPPFLFVRGDPAALAPPLAIGVVGTRAITAYGLAAVRMLVPPLARHAAVVSGLALGVDAAAHTAALEAGGVTVAVLGGGVDPATVAPRANAALAERIVVNGGALASEYPPGANPTPFTFPRRNRIIAGLVRGLLVIEAAERSGALITARLANESGRDVFAVPGPITAARSAGTNALLRHGGIPATSVADVLAEYGIAPDERPRAAFEGRAAAVAALLADAPRTVDELVELTRASAAETLSALAALEIAGAVARIGGAYALATKN